MIKPFLVAGMLATVSGCAIFVPPPRPPEPWMTESGIEILETKAVIGQGAQLGDTLSLHYVMSLADGSAVDSSRDRGTEFSLELGAGAVVPGLTDGLLGMTVGSIRQLTIPPALGFGDRGLPPAVPPGATVYFEIELMAITAM